MAENEKEQTQDPGPFTPDERAYFDSRGEKDIPAAATPPNGATPPEATAPATPPAGAEPVPTSKPEQVVQVPQAALHEERKRRQEADERARQLELLNARMEERFRAFRDAVTPRQQQPQGPPDANRDIFGAVNHLQQENRRTREEIENYKRQIQAEDNLKQLKQWGADAEIAYAQRVPDYYEALNHLRRARANELQVWGMSPSAIGQQLVHEENQLLARAAAERRNPAEMAHQLARQRGYMPKAPAGGQPQPPTNGTSRQEVDLNRIEAGQRQSGSLSQISGNQGRDVGEIEIEDLLKMSDQEFGAFIEKHPARFRRLKGAAH